MQNVSAQKSVQKALAEAKSAKKKGDFSGAEAIYRDVLRRYPGNRTARKSLSQLANVALDTRFSTIVDTFQKRNFTHALTAAIEYLREDPENETILKIQATCCALLGKPEQALETYWKLLANNRNDAELWQMAGNILFEMRRLEDSQDCLNIAIKLEPDNIQHWLQLAKCQQLRGKHEQAYQSLSQALGRDSENATALIQLAQVFRDLAKSDLSVSTLEQARKVAKTMEQRSAASNALGSAKSATNDMAAGRALFRKAIREDPRNVWAMFNLAEVAEAGVDDQLTEQILDLLDQSQLSAAERSHGHFAAFRMLHKRGDDYDRAFDHLEKGNNLRSNLLRYRVSHDLELMKFITNLSERTEQVTQTSAGIRPIFIVGLPRSGTSLTEQMLSAAPDVYAGGEMAVAETLSSAVIREAINHKRDFLTVEDMRSVGDAIRERMTAQSRGAPVVLDKMPLNFRWVWILLASMPDARVINVQRDAIENCWSNYKISFSTGGNGFAYNLGHLGQFYNGYLGLTEQWSKIFPDRFKTLQYQDLIANTENTMRDLVDFCDLGWSDDCLHPERAERAVVTASQHQVRKPIYNGNKGEWRLYESHLGPLLDALSPRDTDYAPERLRSA